MLVIDASAAVELLMATPTGFAIEDNLSSSGEQLAAPHLIDIEVLHAFRRFRLLNVLSAERAEQALEDFGDLSISRYGHEMLRTEIWRLKDNLTAYDATYVSLGILLDAPIVTCDSKLANSQGHNAVFVLFDLTAA